MSSAIPWVLFSATLRCSLRRALPLLRDNPLVILLAAVVALALPLLAVIAGRRFGASVGDAFADETVALSFATSIGVTGAVGGAVVGALAPSTHSLGPQLRSAPLSPWTAFVSLTALPVALLSLAVATLASFFLVPFASQLPGGRPLAVVMLAGAVAGMGYGGAFVEALVTLARGGPAGLLALPFLAALWALGTLAAGGDVLSGPLAYVGDALADPSPALLEPLAVLSLTALGAWAAWAVAAVRRPPERPARSSVRAVVPVPATPFAASFSSALKRYARRRELRRNAVGVICLATGGGLLQQALLPGAAELAFYFAAGTALLGAALVPLAAFGIDREADWLWRSSPEPPGRHALASWLAATLIFAVLVGIAVVPVGLSGGVALGEYVNAATWAGTACAAAIVAGALVPWRSDRLTDQLATYGAYIAATAAATFGVGAAARRLLAAGAPEYLLAAVFVPLAFAVALGAGALIARARSPG